MAAEPLSYEGLLLARQPHPIHTEEQAQQVRDQIQELIRIFPRTEGQDEYLALLGSLLYVWEDGRYEAAPITGVEALRCMLEDNGLTQAALVGPVFNSRSTVSEILSNKRQLTKAHIQKLAEFFHTSPAIFIG